MAEAVEELSTESVEQLEAEQVNAETPEQGIEQEQGAPVSESPSEPAAHEKRIHQRFRVSLRVYIRLSNGDIAQAHAVDLSMGGIYIEYGAPADVNMEFEMAFDLPFKDSFERVFAKAKVVRSIVIGSRNLYGLAFNFIEFGKDTEKVLIRYLEQRHKLCA